MNSTPARLPDASRRTEKNPDEQHRQAPQQQQIRAPGYPWRQMQQQEQAQSQTIQM